MSFKKKKITIKISFIMSVIVSSLFFIHLNETRNYFIIQNFKKSFYISIKLTADMISSGYLQWDKTVNSINDGNDLSDTFREILENNSFVDSLSIIKQNPRTIENLYTIYNINDNLVIDFKILDSEANNYISDTIIRGKINKCKIFKELQSSPLYIIDDGPFSFEFLYGLRIKPLQPPIHIFQVLSSLCIGLLVAFILGKIYHSHSHFFYETRGLEKIIVLFEETEQYSANHSKHVATIAGFLGKKYGLRKRNLKDIKVAALLHDIGKISIPRSILNKKGKLTTQEFEIIKEHSIASERIIKGFEELSHLRSIVKHHHEKMDGSGYPTGLKGEDIPLGSRIIAVADIFEALIGDRPYRNPMKAIDAVNLMKTMSLDSNILLILENNLSEICKLIDK